MVNDFEDETWFVLGKDCKVDKAIDAGVKSYPDKSYEVFAILPEMPTADDVDIAAKLLHFTVYVKLLLIRSLYGQKSSMLYPLDVSIAAQSWLN